jgi:hypothetical protein
MTNGNQWSGLTLWVVAKINVAAIKVQNPALE